jgi:hypothetical protein
VVQLSWKMLASFRQSDARARRPVVGREIRPGLTLRHQEEPQSYCCIAAARSQKGFIGGRPRAASDFVARAERPA